MDALRMRRSINQSRTIKAAEAAAVRLLSAEDW